MPTEKKKQIMDSLEQTFIQCESGIMTDYRGLKTSDLVVLRRKIRESGGEFHIVKNSLARIAAKKAGKDNLGSILEGPMAIVFAKEDIGKSAKALTEYLATSKIALTIKGGFLGNKLIASKDVSTLATMPSKKVMIGKVMGGIQGPLYGLMYGLNAPGQALMTALKARMKQLEGVN
jgi:large subunit ribosomal protein L10